MKDKCPTQIAKELLPEVHNQEGLFLNNGIKYSRDNIQDLQCLLSIFVNYTFFSILAVTGEWS